MPTDDWQHEVERYLAHFSRTGKRPTIVFTQTAGPAWTPAVDVYETAEALVVLVELAGVDATRTEVHAEPQQLTVRGVRRERHAVSEPQEQSTYHALEIPYGRFERSVRLPAGWTPTARRPLITTGCSRSACPSGCHARCGSGSRARTRRERSARSGFGTRSGPGASAGS